MMCIAIGSLMVLAATTGKSPFRPLPEDRPKATEEAAQSPANQPRAGLPHAFGRSFATLDEYLDHLKRRAAPIDLPWWRQVGPDRYERVTARRQPAGKREYATRAELERRFGFVR